MVILLLQEPSRFVKMLEDLHEDPPGDESTYNIVHILVYLFFFSFHGHYMVTHSLAKQNVSALRDWR